MEAQRPLHPEAEGIEIDGELYELAERTAAVLDIDYLNVDLLVTDERALVNDELSGLRCIMTR